MKLAGGSAVVQCKAYSPGNTVGRPAVSQLMGDASVQGAKSAYVVTTSDFSKGARAAARTSNTPIDVRLVDGELLDTWLRDIRRLRSYIGDRQEVTMEIREFISNMRRSGSSTQEIRSELRAAGWTAEEIDAMLGSSDS